MARWSKENPAPYMPNKEGKNGSARAKLQRKYLDAYLAEFEKSGAVSIKILANERLCGLPEDRPAFLPPRDIDRPHQCHDRDERPRTCSSSWRERRQCSRS